MVVGNLWWWNCVCIYYLEKYIVEDLLGAKLAHCVGGLVSDPIKRSGWIFALDEIHDHDCIGSMFYGDTISSNMDPEKNRSKHGEHRGHRDASKKIPSREETKVTQMANRCLPLSR